MNEETQKSFNELLKNVDQVMCKNMLTASQMIFIDQLDDNQYNYFRNIIAITASYLDIRRDQSNCEDCEEKFPMSDYIATIFNKIAKKQQEEMVKNQEAEKK